MQAPCQPARADAAGAVTQGLGAAVLAALGAREAYPGDASAAHFAAAHGHSDIVRALLRYGASLETRNTYGGTVLDATVWFARNAPIEGVDYAAVVRDLLELGARVDVYPELQDHVAAVLAGRHRRLP